MGEKFLKEFRIKKARDFKEIFKKGIYKNIYKHYDFIYKNNNLSFARLGIIVKKKFGKAVVRNYEKRIIREVFRRNIHHFNIQCDIIILLKENGDFDSKRRDILNILKFVHEKTNN